MATQGTRMSLKMAGFKKQAPCAKVRGRPQKVRVWPATSREEKHCAAQFCLPDDGEGGFCSGAYRKEHSFPNTLVQPGEGPGQACDQWSCRMMDGAGSAPRLVEVGCSNIGTTTLLPTLLTSITPVMATRLALIRACF